MLSSKLSYYLLKMLAVSLIERNSLKQAIYFNCSSLKILAAERSSLEIRSAQPPPTSSWPSGQRVSKCSMLKWSKCPTPQGLLANEFQRSQNEGLANQSAKCKSQLVKDNKCGKDGQKAFVQSKNIWRLVLCVRTGWQKLCEGTKGLRRKVLA